MLFEQIKKFMITHIRVFIATLILFGNLISVRDAWAVLNFAEVLDVFEFREEGGGQRVFPNPAVNFAEGTPVRNTRRRAAVAVIPDRVIGIPVARRPRAEPIAPAAVQELTLELAEDLEFEAILAERARRTQSEIDGPQILRPRSPIHVTEMPRFTSRMPAPPAALRPDTTFRGRGVAATTTAASLVPAPPAASRPDTTFRGRAIVTAPSEGGTLSMRRLLSDVSDLLTVQAAREARAGLDADIDGPMVRLSDTPARTGRTPLPTLVRTPVRIGSPPEVTLRVPDRSQSLPPILRRR